MTDAWHPNWSVFVNGQKVHLGRVNEAFRGIALSPGQYAIEMRYAPRTFALAKMITIGGLLIVCLVLMLRSFVDSAIDRWFGGTTPRLRRNEVGGQSP